MPSATTASRGPGTRLLDFVRPALPRLLLGMLCALGASLAALAIPLVLEAVVNGPLLGSASDGDRRGVWIAVAVVAGLGLAEAALIYLRRAMVLGPSTAVEASMRRELFTHLQDLPSSFHDSWSGGQLLSRSMTDLSMLRRFMAFGLVMLVVNTTTIVVGVGLMIWLGGPLGVVYLLGAIPVIALSYYFSTQFRRVARLSQDQAGDLATIVEESVHGIRVLKAFGRGQHAEEGFTRQADSLRATEITKARILSAITFFLTVIPEAVLAVCLVWGVLRVAGGDMSVGSLVAFFATAAVVSMPVEMVGGLIAIGLGARASFERFAEVMDTSNTVADPDTPASLEAGTTGSPRPARLSFEDVWFAYPEAPPALDGADRRPGVGAVLRGVDLEVRPGETLALVGITGSGKTTLAMLVPRLHDVTSGAVRIDGVDVRDVTRGELRTAVAVAFEDATLFSDSVRENVLLGAPPGHDGEADLDRALDVAQAGFVRTLPDGVDTLIGEEGMSLSGGQRQRLALARAIAARPRVLVLDDPLSALDVETEERVQEALRRELDGVTTLIVAHRPSTVALADRVALLDGGRVLALGPHTELLATSEAYRHVVSSLESEGAGVAS